MGVVKSISSFLHMLSLPQPELEVYCREKRLERYEQCGGRVRYLRLHAFAHRILLPLMRAEIYLSGQRLTVLRSDRKKTARPIIFCPTHIGGADIEMSFLAVHTPCWFVLGDPHELYKSIDGMVLQMNGMIALDTLQKPDRIAAKAQMKALLKKGGNLLLFPEGTQNISPNALVGYLYAGAVDLAITCGAEIVPIAIDREGSRYSLIIGENIRYDGCAYEDRFRLTDELRDRMAALKWEIIERKQLTLRREISEITYKNFIENILVLNAKYKLTMDDIRAGQFRPKGITQPREAFAHLDKLIPCRENAFLFRRRDKAIK